MVNQEIQTKGERSRVPATRDTFVHYLFGTPGNEWILLDFINAVQRNARQPVVKSVEMRNPFNPTTFVTAKYSVMDVKATDESGRIFAMEFQTCEHDAFIERLIYYWAICYLRQLLSGRPYSDLRPVVSIAVVGFLLFHKLRKIHNQFRITAEDDPNFVLTDAFLLHVIEATEEKIDQLSECDPSLDRWIYFFYNADKVSEEEMQAKIHDDKAIEAAYAEYRKFHSDEQLRILDDVHQLFIHDYYTDLEGAEARGEAKGRFEGEALGVLRILKNRFGLLPQEMIDAVRMVSDTSQFDLLSDTAMSCDSLKDFTDAMKR